MQFHEKRRQQFLGESAHQVLRKVLEEDIEYFSTHPYGTGNSTQHKDALGRLTAARSSLSLLELHYTAGEPIEPLRAELDRVVAAYERYAALLWKNTQDRNDPVFEFDVIDDYCQLVQLVGLCFLLHRRDLLPRLAALQDGEKGGNGGVDTLYEEFMAYGLGPDTRYETDWMCWKRPYEPLFHALTETTTAAQLKELDQFLKHWYKDLAGTGWHDSHKPNEAGDQGGYSGYWSFEAGAAVLLLNIEDDSSLHKYLYYPKDLVAWAKQHAALSDASDKSTIRLRAMAGEPCPREGFWVTPAKTNSRKMFKGGEVMPDVGGDYGITIWQWDDKQDS
jgi:Domain of unknown function (DUF1911)